MSRKIKKSQQKSKEEVSKIQFGDMENMGLRERRELIKIVFKERIFLRKKFFQDAWKILQNNIIEETRWKRQKLEADIKKHEEFIEDKQSEYNEAKEEYEKSLAKLNKAREKLLAAKDYHKKLEENFDSANNELNVQQKIRADMDKIILLHPTASLIQVHRYQVAKIIVNDCDAEIFEGLMPDEVCDTNRLEHLINIFPANFEKKYVESARESIIKYCELVANVIVCKENENVQIIALFNNDDIAKILKLNGLDLY